MIEPEAYQGLYRRELQDLYDAERQIINALPEMIKAASSDELKAALEDHLQQTKQQLERLSRIFAGMNERPEGKISDGMRALLADGRMRINELPPSGVLDVALIAAGQKVEHYEISGYGTARTLAEMLSHDEAAALLEQTLEEEKETDALLTDIAEDLVAGDEMLDEEEIEDEEIKSE